MGVWGGGRGEGVGGEGECVLLVEVLFVVLDVHQF